MNIHEAVNSRGVDGRFYSIRGKTDSDEQVFSLGEGLLRRYGNVLAYRLLGIEGFFNNKLWQEALNDLNEYDLVHLHNAHGYYLPLEVLTKLLKKPCVWTLHDYRLVTGGAAFPMPSYVKSSVTEKLLSFANFDYPGEWIDRSVKRKERYLRLVENYEPALVAVSQTMRKNLYEYGLPEEQTIHVIPHGLFEHTSPPDAVDRLKAREELGWPGDRHTFLFVSARIDNPVKGFSYFSEALNKLPDKDNCTAYVIGSSYEHIEKRVASMDLDIHFLGRVEQENMMRYYRACDTYVSSSLDETFGRTVVEAGAEGAEIICSDLPIFREVTEGRARFFEPANPSELCDKLRKVIKEPLTADERRQYAEETREQFSRQKMAEQYLTLYQNLTGT